jgi:tetratricopeptide (TPR) repeat protein
MKALEKDRTRRYASANGLALDVQRFLADEAITARPPSRVYRFEMLVLRNKLLFTAIGAMALLLVGALIVVSLALSRERESRRKAVEASVKSQRVTQFLEDMMNRAGPAAARGRDSGMMIDILNETAGHIEKELGNQPDVEADLRGIIGKLYEQLGLYAQGEKMERQALAFREQKFGPESREAAESLNDLGLELMAQHKLPEAEKAHARAYAIRRRLFGDENAETATSLNDLGAVYRDQGRLKEAEAMAREALRIRRKLFGPQHQDVADSLRNLSIILGGESRWEEAKQAAMETLIMRSNVLGPDHPFIASSLEDVAWTDSGLGQFKEAEQLDAEALALRQRVLGDAHPDIGRNLNALGQLLFNQRDVPTSEAVLKVALSIQRKLVGETNQATLETLDALARDLANEDKYAEAESVSREALAVWNTRSDNDNPQRLFLLRDLAEILEKENRWPEAEALWRESLPLWRQRRNIEDSEPMYTLRKLGLALEAEHKFPEAEAVHREAWSISRKKGDEDAEAVADLGKLGRVLLNQKKFAEAQEILDKALTPTMVRQPWSASLQAERVAVMGRQGRWPDAEKDAALAIEYQPTDHYSYHILAGLLAIQQERPAYEKLCQRMFTNFSNPENPYIAERIAQDCLLLTNSGVDLRLVDKLADTAVTRGSSEASLPYFQACKAMSSYRLGRFREAILWGERSVSKPTAEAPGKAKALAVLAMAHWQLGEKDEARTALASGDNLAPRLLPGVGPVDLGDSWVAWLQARISLDEAASMIEPASALEGPPKN